MDLSDRVAEALKALERGDTGALADLIDARYPFTPSDTDALRAVRIERTKANVDRKARAKIRFKDLRYKGASREAAIDLVVAEFNLTLDAAISAVDGKEKAVRERVRELGKHPSDKMSEISDKKSEVRDGASR